MILKENGYAKASYIQALMKKALAKGKAIHSQDIFNVHVRAKMLKMDMESKVICIA